MIRDEETWTPIIGTDGRYEVSDLGRVRAMRRRHRYGEKRLNPPRIMARYIRRGYRCTMIEGKNRRLNRLVLESFSGPAPAGSTHAAHLNGDRWDNSRANLAWVSPVENERQKRLHGRIAAGERQGHSKLTTAEVLTIRSLDGKTPTRDIASRFGIHRNTVLQIQARQRWTHV